MDVSSFLLLISLLKVLHCLYQVLNSYSLGMLLDPTNAFIYCAMCSWGHMYIEFVCMSICVCMCVCVYLTENSFVKKSFRLVNKNQCSVFSTFLTADIWRYGLYQNCYIHTDVHGYSFYFTIPEMLLSYIFKIWKEGGK